jgi:ribosomal protein S18 acetylase RimI-like enzyme
MAAPFLIERLGSSHNRESFSCGVEALDQYFRTQATQDVRRRAAACYVAIEAAGAKVAGFYTLAAAGVPLAEMPAELAKRLLSYPSDPVARLGGLAVGQASRVRKLGSALLWDAVQRSLRSEIAVFALVIDAKDDQAEAFYRHHGFVAFGSRPIYRGYFTPADGKVPWGREYIFLVGTVSIRHAWSCSRHESDHTWRRTA